MEQYCSIAVLQYCRIGFSLDDRMALDLCFLRNYSAIWLECSVVRGTDRTMKK